MPPTQGRGDFRRLRTARLRSLVISYSTLVLFVCFLNQRYSFASANPSTDLLRDQRQHDSTGGKQSPRGATSATHTSERTRHPSLGTSHLFPQPNDAAGGRRQLEQRPRGSSSVRNTVRRRVVMEAARRLSARLLRAAVPRHRLSQRVSSRQLPRGRRSALFQKWRRRWRQGGGGSNAQDPNPYTYDPTWPWSSAGKGKCTRFAIRLPIRSASEFSWRRFFPPRITVILLLRKSFTVSKTIVFNRNYSCTILKGAGAQGAAVTISISNDKVPILNIWNTSNVLVYNVSFNQPVTASSPAYSWKIVPEIKGTSSFACPAISIWSSYGVQIAQGSVFGRIEVARSMSVSIDSMKLTTVFSYLTGAAPVRVLVSGNGPTILRAGISISNNEIYGTDNGIILHNGAVGVDVYNNYIHDYGFAGIRCGDFISQQGDCMATNIFRNYVVKTKPPVREDTAGIYYQTHWVNPSNYATCNYVEGGDHCYYLDNAASGITIDGGVCLNTWDGIKLNLGKGNVVKHIVQKAVSMQSAYLQCIFTPTMNCLQTMGKIWSYFYTTYYNTPEINKAAPFLSDICTATTANGNNLCNDVGGANASATGGCSGLPTENTVDVLLVNAAMKNVPPLYAFCSSYNVSKLNTLSSMNQTQDYYQFIDYDNNNLGVSSSSPVYSSRPDFRSCDRELVGPTAGNWTQFKSRFNIPVPSGFSIVLKLDYLQVADPKAKP